MEKIIKMIEQKYILNKIHWDNMIILDACRYDVFHRLWSREERVIEALSPASWTLEWLDRVFGNKFVNANVFSATPYINSMFEIYLYGIRWDAKKHFRKIIDLWLSAWDDKLGTVPPEKVFLSVLLHDKFIKNKKNITKKKIIWFLQPHYPYISKSMENVLGKNRQRITYNDFLAGRMDTVLRKMILDIAAMNRSIILSAYEETLDRVLRVVYKLIRKLNGTIIITSDHGELLGENIIIQLLSTVNNLITEGIRHENFAHISRRLNVLSTIVGNKLRAGDESKAKKRIGSSYVVGGKVFFHPPLLYGTTQRKVPLVIIK